MHAHGYLEGGDPGKDSEKIVYSECSLPNSAGCDPFSQGQMTTSGIIETKALISELVYLTEKAAKNLEAAITGTVFKPASGNFVELLLNALTGHTCPVSGLLPVKGEVIGENLFATLRLLLGTLTFPKTAIGSYWLDTGSGTATKDTITKLTLDGTNATYLGEVSIKVSLLGQFGQWLAFWVCP